MARTYLLSIISNTAAAWTARVGYDECHKTWTTRGRCRASSPKQYMAGSGIELREDRLSRREVSPFFNGSYVPAKAKPSCVPRHELWRTQSRAGSISLVHCNPMSSEERHDS